MKEKRLETTQLIVNKKKEKKNTIDILNKIRYDLRLFGIMEIQGKLTT